MSLATLARKSRTTNPRFRRDPCFVLNMTGRGHIIGGKFNAAPCRSKGKYPNFGGCSAGGNTTCCSANHTTPKDCKKGCGCWYGGLSQPAPQMSYGNYLNRKSKGAYRPGGQQCCDTSNNLTANKIIWQQSPNITAGEIIQQKKDTTIACYNNLNNNSSLTGRCSVGGCGTGKNTYIELWKACLDPSWNITNSATPQNPLTSYFGYRRNGPNDIGGSLSNTNLLGINIERFAIQNPNNLGPASQTAGWYIQPSENNDPFSAPAIKKQLKTVHITFCDDLVIHLNFCDARFNVDAAGNPIGGGGQPGGIFWPINNPLRPASYWEARKNIPWKIVIEIEKTKKDVSCSTKKNYLHSTDLVRYTRINHNFCNTTKKLPYNTAGDLITRRRAANMCPKFGVMGFKKPININRCKK